MYKKTTTIIEEHGTKPNDSSNTKFGSIFDNISPRNTDLGIATRVNSREFWSLLVIHLREYLNTAYDRLPTTNLRSTIHNLSTTDFIRIMDPWFSSPLSTDQITGLTNATDAMTSSFCDVIDAIINGKDRDVAISNAQKAITNYTSYLNTLAFPFDKTRTTPVLINYLNLLIKQVDSKMSKEWGLDLESFLNGYSIIASDSVPGIVPFSDAITTGLFAWQPWRFQ